MYGFQSNMVEFINELFGFTDLDPAYKVIGGQCSYVYMSAVIQTKLAWNGYII